MDKVNYIQIIKCKMLRIAVVLFICISASIHAQTNIPNTSPVTQNFDGMAATTTIPANWKMHQSASPTWAGGTTTLGAQASSGSPTAGATYNWGAGAGERALGVMTSGGYASPNSVMGFFRNTNASAITQLAISYDLERYRINTAAASVQFYYSTDGSTWIPVTAGDIAGATIGTGTNTYGYPQASFNVSPFNITGLNIANNSDVYLRWNLNTTGSNSQGIGIDNFSLTATFGSAGPTITLSPATLTGLNYTFASGPSGEQTFTCSGTNLTANIAFSAPINYEISLTSGSGFSTSLSLTPVSGTVSSTTIYVRLKAGLAIGSYNSEVITASSSGATSQTVTCSGSVTATSTTLSVGDIAIVGMCVDINGCAGSTTSSEDEISFVSFEDITPGTTIDITDNGFERSGCSNNTWGNTEGVIRITRTTSTIPKGTIVTLRVIDQTIFNPIQPDGSWTVTYPNSGYGTFNMNGNDEQIYIMQGGTWNKNTSGGHDATYAGGTLMFAINTYTAWTCNGLATTRGNLPLALRCFSILPGIASKHIKYTGPVTPASQKDWIDRLNSASNWTGTNTCAAYIASGLDYGGTSQIFTILAGGFNAGNWTGATSTDWYDCNNWQNYKVPDSLANVTIDNVANDPVIASSPVLYPNGAVCNDLLVTSTSGAGMLTLNNAASYLSVKGNLTNNGTITASLGTTDLRSANAQTISGSGTSTFYDLRLNNTNASGVSLSQNITASNTLTFINGRLNTGANRMIITNTTVPTISGYSSGKFINGNLRQSIATNTSTYALPIGDGTATTNYKRADLVNNNLTGVSYIDASVSSITETAPNDDATFASAAQTQGASALAYIDESAQWDLSPNAAPGTGTYGVRLYIANTLLSAADDDQFFAVKRPSNSTTYADWLSHDATTTIPASGAAGRIYNSGNGYAERLGYTSFSKHGIATVMAPLPIELLQFAARANEKTITLNWATASETNNDYFTIERSADAIEFSVIGTVEGAGNSTTIRKYSLVDDSPLSGINYYRLKQTDFDGKTSYSGIVSATIQLPGIQSIYPNPATDKLNIRLSDDTETRIFVEILDIRGISVSKQETQKTEKGDLTVSLEGIPAGTYILRTHTATETTELLFVKQ